MTRLKRSLVLASLVTLTLAGTLGGCASSAPQPAHKTMAATQYDKWNRAREAIMMQLATQQYEVGDYDKCRHTLAEVIGLNVPSAAIYDLGAKVELEKGSLELAETYLKTAVTIDPNSAESYYLLGVLYQRWENTSAARDYYKMAFEKKPSDPSYLLAEVEMMLTLGQTADAKTLLVSKEIYFEQSSALRAALARIDAMQGDYEGAARLYQEATILDPDAITLQISLAEAYYFCGKYDNVVSMLEAINQNDQTDHKVLDRNSMMMLLGQSYLKVGRAADAQNIFADLTRQDPQLKEAWLGMGKACIDLHDYLQAASCASHLLQDHADDMDALLLLALAQQKQKCWADADQTLDRAAAIDPNNPTVLCMRGASEQSQGHDQLAATWYARAVQINPADPLARELLHETQAQH